MTQSEALSILKTGANVFLTGSPGSGKTHVTNEYVAWLRACGIEPSVTAATGIAATHVGGMTLHAWSGIGIAEALSEADVDRIAGKEHIARRIQKAKVLIIDEISMLSANTFSMADRVCREVRRTALPFGGLQVIMVGDFFQLPPVSRGGSETLFAYEASAWRELNPLICYLTEQYRQDDDEFLSVLSAIRANDVEELHFEHLEGRITGIEKAPREAPKLFSHNADVDRINAQELAKLPGEKKVYRMNGKGRDLLIDGLKRGCLSPETLELKRGAAVMFTKNSPLGNYVNGTLGTVADFSAEGMPLIRTRDGRMITAEPAEWQVEEQGKVRASITQVPLRLAWAMTVHKSQGMSMDAAIIDLSQAFEYGQGYVALSRVRRLSGVYLLGINDRALRVHPEIVDKDIDMREASEAAAATFAAMDDEELEGMQKRFVKAQGGAWPKGKHAAAPTDSGIPSRLAATLGIVRDASSLAEAAKARALTPGTVIKHLEDLRKLGKLSPDDFRHIAPEGSALGRIHDAIRAVETDRLAPVFAALDGDYSFEEIRLARLLDAE